MQGRVPGQGSRREQADEEATQAKTVAIRGEDEERKGSFLSLVGASGDYNLFIWHLFLSINY